MLIDQDVEAPNGAIHVGRNKKFPYTREGLHEFIRYAMDRYACCFDRSPLRVGGAPRLEPVDCAGFFHSAVVTVFNEVSSSLCAACGLPVSQAFSREKQNAPVCFVRAGIVALMRRAVFMRRWRQLGTTRGRPKEFIDWHVIPILAGESLPAARFDEFTPISTLALTKLMLLDESSIRKLSARWAVDEFRFSVS